MSHMSHIHWVSRQNKLETPKEKDEVNKREVHECDGRARDPDAMVAPPTSKPTQKIQPSHTYRNRGSNSRPPKSIERNLFLRS